MLLVFGYLFFPVMLVFLCQRLVLLDKIGVVLLSFAVGIAIAAGLDLVVMFELEKQAIQGIQTQVSEVSVALAIPLLLFSIDIKAAFSQVAGMAVGAYTGGGPNMAAIKTAIHGDESIFILFL